MAALKVAIFGAGNIGAALAVALCEHTDFSVSVFDWSEDALDRISGLSPSVKTHHLRQRDELAGLLKGYDVTVAAVPESIVPSIAKAAAEAETHYLDFSPARPNTRELLRSLSEKRAVMQGCGVSPGIIDCVATDLAAAFSPLRDLVVRVGSVPRFPTNRLGYGQIWHVDGLIDEYTQPSAAIRDGQLTNVAPLEEYERFVIDGISYEEFTSSNGMEDLSIFTNLSPNNVTFKTLRYPGHRDYMLFLLDDLGLRNRRDMLRTLLMNGLPVIEEDVLLLAVTARGMRDHRLHEKTIVHRFQADANAGSFNSLTSVAAGYAANLLSLLATDGLPQSGFVAHYKLDPQNLFSSRFLKHLIQA